VPSWKLHRRIYEKLRLEVEGFVVWTPGLLDKIDRIIDAGGEHDVGRRPDPQSFERMLRELWLEFGDVYDAAGGRRLNLSSRFERQAWLNEAISKGTLQDSWLYIPDDAMVLATLHHILDLCMDAIYRYHIKEGEAHSMIKRADEALKSYCYELRNLTTGYGSSFEDVYRWLIGVLDARAERIYRMLAAELRAKRLRVCCNPRELQWLLVSYTKSKGYTGIIYVNNRPLPVAAAANKILGELGEEHKVVLGFTRVRGPYPPIYEQIKASTLEELCRKLGYSKDSRLDFEGRT